MNRIHDYGGVRDEQLRTLEHLGMFGKSGKNLEPDRLPKRPKEYRRLPDPSDPMVSVEERARAYLHANCSQCHVQAGGGNAMIDLEFTTPLEKTRLIDVPPNHDTFGIKDARLIAPGLPERSILLHRIGCRGKGQMPPLATSQIDADAVALIREWILGMQNGMSEPRR